MRTLVLALLETINEQERVLIKNEINNSTFKNENEIVKTLIHAGADVNTKGASRPIIQFAIDNHDHSLIKMLLEAGAKTDVKHLKQAVDENDIYTFEMLLEHGCDFLDEFEEICYGISRKINIIDLILDFFETTCVSPRDAEYDIKFRMLVCISYYASHFCKKVISERKPKQLETIDYFEEFIKNCTFDTDTRTDMMTQEKVMTVIMNYKGHKAQICYVKLS